MTWKGRIENEFKNVDIKFVLSQPSPGKDSLFVIIHGRVCMGSLLVGRYSPGQNKEGLSVFVLCAGVFSFSDSREHMQLSMEIIVRSLAERIESLS